MRPPAILLAGIFLSAFTSFGESEHESSSWFRRTPAEEMRPITAEQLGVTRSPYTVDAGHVQFETELINYVQEHYPRSPYFWWPVNYTVEQFAWSPLLRVGLSDRIELQGSVTYFQVFEELRSFYFDIFGLGLTEVTRKRDYSYFGHATGAVKVNLLGNDGGNVALSLVPFVVVPLEDKREDVAGGVDIPFEWKLPAHCKLRLNSGVTVYNHDFLLNNSANLSTRLFNRVDLYGEFSSWFFLQNQKRWAGYVGTGASWDIASNFQVQAGINFGVTEYAYDRNPFLRIICRF